MTKYEKLFGVEWARKLKPFIDSDAFKVIGKTLMTEHNSRKAVFPVFDDVFRAFRECPYDQLVSVFLTNNAYIKGEMDGLAFSARKAEFLDQTPEQLRKIFDAVESEVANGLYLDRDNDLTRWANQGVLLLNCDLTTEKGKVGSHIELWKPFIEYVMKMLAQYNTGLIYVLIGKEAAKYEPFVNKKANDYYLIEHPMVAVVKHRAWKFKDMFETVNRVSDLINNKKIQWT
jgi:uracil-DNA glycosylase